MPFDENIFYHWLLIGWFALSAGTFLFLFFITAPYGRHQRPGWGPAINAKAGWVLMEFPAVAAMALFFFLGNYRNPMSAVFVGLWLFHYLYRAFVFPALLGPGAKSIPLVIAGSGFVFNAINGYLNGRYLFSLSPSKDLSWLGNPRFILGGALFFTGFFIHVWSDKILRNLRKPGDTGYKMPSGGLYRWISCPNYFGEMLQWCGWAVATWSAPGFAFFIWTSANLLPRAISHHKWYRQTFAEYPPKRKALIPFVL